MRGFYSRNNQLAYKEIEKSEDDARAKRITAYLNLIHDLVDKQMEKIKQEPFTPESDISKYFTLLPDCPNRHKYMEMLATTDQKHKKELQEELREVIVPGSIDVNLMTKINPPAYKNDEELPPEYALALSGFRGFANSKLNSAIVLSAGMNKPLFTYMACFDDFFPESNGYMKKKIILKVSDFRSAQIQGKILAKLGLWVSEYRIESGLNCGGHAFTSKGHLLGPILEEFKQNKSTLISDLFKLYRQKLEKSDRICPDSHPEVKITVQGGIGTFAEDRFLMKYYEVDGTGWGTPFLLVPEVTNVDIDHLRKLSRARREDVDLSDNSPLGVPFWILKTSASEIIREERIKEGKPGSPCPKGYLGMDFEFTKRPICRASRAYQKLKIRQLSKSGMSQEMIQASIERVIKKSCICLDLAGGVMLKNGLVDEANPAVCTGPGIENFSKIATLEEMVDHVYGRNSLLNNNERLHMFIIPK